MDGMRRAIVLAVMAAALATIAAPAAASTFQGAIAIRSIGRQPTPGASIAVSAEATIAQQCDPGTPCAYLPFVTTVPGAQTCAPALSASSWVGDPVGSAAAGTPQTVAPIWRERPSDASGPKRACLYVRSAAGDVLVAETAYTVPRPVVLPITADIPRAAIPRSVGVRRPFAYRLSTALVPRGVSPVRFRLLVRAAAARWGLRFAGTTSRPPRLGDGVDSVGFSSGVPRVALGVTSIRVERLFRVVNGRRQLVRQQVVERDTRFARGVPWFAGPGDPPSDQVDLQTVVIHELGHFAGNDHVRNCTDSPMWVALRPGEWWHTRADWFQFGCGRAVAAGTRAATPAATAPSTPRRMLVERSYRDVTIR